MHFAFTKFSVVRQSYDETLRAHNIANTGTTSNILLKFALLFNVRVMVVNKLKASKRVSFRQKHHFQPTTFPQSSDLPSIGARNRKDCSHSFSNQFYFLCSYFIAYGAGSQRSRLILLMVTRSQYLGSRFIWILFLERTTSLGRNLRTLTLTYLSVICQHPSAKGWQKVRNWWWKIKDWWDCTRQQVHSKYL